MIKELNIIGSGLSGPLLATFLGKKNNYNINMFERSFDSRKSMNYSGRSINLALSKRGIHALKNADVYNKKFEAQLIPMYGRAIHDLNGNQSIQLYGNKKNHYINSISRSVMNNMLIDAAEKTKKVSINFNMKCTAVKLQTQELIFENNNIKTNGPIIGSDGYRSVASKAIADLYNDQLHYVVIEHSYKELTIKPRNNEYQLDPDYLHIWPRRDLMVIALPNMDKSFTCTLFMKTNGANSFDSISDTSQLYKFFEKNFNDLIPLIDNLDSSYFNNPTGRLVGLKVPKWHYEGKALVIGDAAHATVPFYGQGMNAAFEDCYILNKIIDENKNAKWEEIFNIFYNTRKKDADAILDLSLLNYKIMRNDVLDKSFINRQKLSFLLNERFPDQFIPIYTMISFTRIPYEIALNRAKIQDEILDILMNDLVDISNYNKKKSNKLINEKLSKVNEDNY